jgi:hypothetical protein
MKVKNSNKATYVMKNTKDKKPDILEDEQTQLLDPQREDKG